MGWELFRRDSSDGFEMVGVDSSLLTDAPVAALPIAVEVTVTAPSTLPAALAPTEQAISGVTGELGGRIAGTVRSDTTLFTLVYLPTDDTASRLSEIPLPARASISVAPAVDPDWLTFDRVRPVAMEEQSMADLRVMAALHEGGDRGGRRRIEHVVSGLTADRFESFASAVRSLGFAVRAGDGDDGGVAELTHEADPADITADSWTIRLVAERHGGTYDGWGCPVVGNGHGNGHGNDDGPTSKRRRWRR